MERINEEFNIPYYIFEEIIEYIELNKESHCKCMKWENIKSLLNMAMLNNRLTQNQVNHLIKKYCREEE